MKQDKHDETSFLIDLQEQLSDIRLRIALLEAARSEDEAAERRWKALPENSPERVAERRFHERMDREVFSLLRKVRRKQKIKKTARFTYKVARAAAVVFLAGCIGLGTAMAVSSEIRVTVMKLLYNVTPQYTEIRLAPDDSASFRTCIHNENQLK